MPGNHYAYALDGRGVTEAVQKRPCCREDRLCSLRREFTPVRAQSRRRRVVSICFFTCSWHQNPESFFLRGGLDVVRAFEIIHERYPHARLTLRTGLPKLKPRFRRVLEKCWVRVIDRYLPDDEMDELMRSTHIFVLPAARIHVVSVLRAMAHGQVVVASDGWGFREYVEHRRNRYDRPWALWKSLVDGRRDRHDARKLRSYAGLRLGGRPWSR